MFSLSSASTSFGQNVPPSGGIQYSQPIEADSLQNYIVGLLPTRINKDKYIVNTLQYDYSGNNLSIWTNIIFYNTQSKLVTKLFEKTDLISMSPLTGWYAGITSYKNQHLSVIFGKFILLSIKTDDYNKDGVIDETDPVSLFVCTKAGEHLVQISPKDMNVTAWTLSRDGKVIIAKIQKDKNSDKRFINEDEEIYQIDLDGDFNKIKATPISVN
jgi:hypothetical protein